VKDFGDEVKDESGGVEERSSGESARLFDNSSFTCTLVHVACSRAKFSVTSGKRKSDVVLRRSLEGYLSERKERNQDMKAVVCAGSKS
jgi:hypothetical protein